MTQPLSPFNEQNLILKVMLLLQGTPLALVPSSWFSKSILLLFFISSIDYSNLLREEQSESLVYRLQLKLFNFSRDIHHTTTEKVANTTSSSLILAPGAYHYYERFHKKSNARQQQQQQRSAISRSFDFRNKPDAFRNHKPIPFQEEWINDFNFPPHDAIRKFSEHHTIVKSPNSLPIPHFVMVYDLELFENAVGPSSSSAHHHHDAGGCCNLKELAQKARKRIDQNLHKTGAMLFRNLHQSIQNATDFATFWNHVVASNGNTTNASSSSWNPMTDHLSCYNRKRRRRGVGENVVDQVDTDVPTYTIGPHNEHSCNPRPSDKIFFYALHPAPIGGESLLRRNADIVVPHEARQLVQEAGGLQFTRSYPAQKLLDSLQKDRRHPSEISWEERTNTNQKEQAKEYFATKHGITNITFHPQDHTLTAHTILPGFLLEEDKVHCDANNSGNDQKQLLWFNRIDYGFPVQLADGTVFPLALQSKLKRQKWHETSALKLQRGDWLVLDNYRVQHGRLPYQDVKDLPARQLLVTYTSPPTSSSSSS